MIFQGYWSAPGIIPCRRGSLLCSLFNGYRVIELDIASELYLIERFGHVDLRQQ